jgi:dipeptidase E
MKKLLLTSDGLSNKRIKKEFLRLVPKDASDAKVLLIVTAGKNSKKSKKYMKETKGELAHIGILEKNMKTLDIDGKKNYSIDKKFDVIYVCGGNTFFLLKKVRESGFGKAVKKFLSGNKLYVGVSAGSYIACPTIDMAAWKNIDTNFVGLKDLTAIKLVNFMVTAHYAKIYEKAVKAGASKSKYKVRLLKDGQALSIAGNKVRLVGIGKEARIG